jgi:hypothetical protein
MWAMWPVPPSAPFLFSDKRQQRVSVYRPVVAKHLGLERAAAPCQPPQVRLRAPRQFGSLSEGQLVLRVFSPVSTIIHPFRRDFNVALRRWVSQFYRVVKVTV